MAQKFITNSKRDKLINQCEKLILQGTESPTEISDTLNISYNTAKTYIKIIRERWASDTDIFDLQEKRKDLIRKTEEIVREAWRLCKTSKNTLEAVGSLRTALMAIERLEKLQGVDSLPSLVEKHQEIQIFELAQEIVALPPKEGEMAISRVREEIMKRK